MIYRGCEIEKKDDGYYFTTPAGEVQGPFKTDGEALDGVDKWKRWTAANPGGA